MTTSKILTLVSCTALLPGGAWAAVHSEANKPNILIILADDLGLGDLSCQYSTDMRTPNIDSLFTGGVRLDSFYANSSVSSPSRAGLMTGCYPDMVGVPGVIRGDGDGSWGYLLPGCVTLPDMMRKAGYNTAHIGKWNLGLESPNLPNERGFDLYHGFLGDMMDDYYTHLRKGSNYMRLNDQTINPQGHATELFTDWAVEYIDHQAGQKAPFFLYLAYNAPHYPVQPPAEWEQKVRERENGISQMRGKYVALIEHMDYNIGKVIDALRRSKQLENTLVIFTSDNGGYRPSEANNGPTRGFKGDMFEGGIHVPCAVYWKGTLAPVRYDNLVMMSDIFPTLCELTGVKMEHPVDGISVLPLLRSGSQVTDDRYVFWMRREHGAFCGLTQEAARYKEYKLVHNTPFEPMLFFDLKTDPREADPLKPEGNVYDDLRKNFINHINRSGAIPWQKMDDHQ